MTDDSSYTIRPTFPSELVPFLGAGTFFTVLLLAFPADKYQVSITTRLIVVAVIWLILGSQVVFRIFWRIDLLPDRIVYHAMFWTRSLPYSDITKLRFGASGYLRVNNEVRPTGTALTVVGRDDTPLFNVSDRNMDGQDGAILLRSLAEKAPTAEVYRGDDPAGPAGKALYQAGDADETPGGATGHHHKSRK